MSDDSATATIPDEVQLAIRLEGIFMPFFRRQRDGFYKDRKRFVHYTSADNALRIMSSKRLWMRNTNCMADYREVQHGFDMLKSFFHDVPKKERFVAALDGCVPGVAIEALQRFDQWWQDTSLNTYISSVSEHNDSEDRYGRLSMWRAFGGNTARVAIVFRIPLYTGGAEKLCIMFSPVGYLDKEGVSAEIDTVISNIQAEAEFLLTADRAKVFATVFSMLVVGAVCVKHPGFDEEREWRVIYAPNRWASPLIESSMEVVGGVPQLVYKVPFDVGVSDALDGLDFARIFDRLIIGPSPYPWPMYQAFVDALTKSGVPDAGKKVFISDIPIRT